MVYDGVMKTLNIYAKEHGIKYRAAWNRYKRGEIPGAFKDEFGKILMPDDVPDRPIGVDFGEGFASRERGRRYVYVWICRGHCYQ